MYDFLIVGAGLFGSVFANIAKSKGKKVLVIDKRSHIGGNCFTENVGGIHVHAYGPHIFHTSSDEIWEYINRFVKFNSYVNRPKVNYEGKIYSFPINLMTLYQLWGVSTPNEAIKKLEEVKVKIDDPRNLEEWILSQVGREIYEKFIYGYTKKQWMKDPKDLPSFIIKRLPIRLTYDDNYYNDTYQGIPVEGYTRAFTNMLEGCEVEVGIDYFSNREKFNNIAKTVVYTGKIDEFFGYSFGELEYRSLRFERLSFENLDYQGNAIVNYTHEKVPYTRVAEHKHFNIESLHKNSHTIVTKEFPIEWNRNETPYYPIGDERNTEIYKKYKEASQIENNVLFGGRLAEYKYYDMHQVIGSALQKAKKLIN
jgi:UDP-galactopyranose mutase